MRVEWVPPHELMPYEGNPRRRRKASSGEDAVSVVAESIERYGFNQPIVVDEDSVVVVGHTRLAAALRLGLDHVPVFRVHDLTDDEARGYRIADNKTAEWTQWDLDKLIAETSLGDEIPGMLVGELASLHAVDFGSTTGEVVGGGQDNRAPGQQEFVQLTFDVPREHLIEIRVKCEEIVERYESR